MNIQQAAKEARAQNKAITRESWLEYGDNLSIIPTDGPDCCIARVDGRDKGRWEPQYEDLVADDWSVTE